VTVWSAVRVAKLFATNDTCGDD